MTRPARTTRVLPLTAAAVFAVLTIPALAQGTKEQREACAPDAINLCSDTIPDVDKTAACMKRHFKQLSPACQTAFNAATGPEPGAAAPHRERPADRVGRDEQGYPEGDVVVPGGRQYGYVEPEPLDDGLDTSRNVIRQLCREGMIDPGTCQRSARMLNIR